MGPICHNIFRGRNLFHAGVIAAGRRPGGAKPGELCEEAMSSGTGNYLANLILYPGVLTIRNC